MKRIISLVLALISVLVFVPGVFALDLNGEIDPNYILDSSVEEDLSLLYVDNKPFREQDYPVNTSADYITLLSLVEYGYHPYSDDYYFLIFYIYNPGCGEILDSSNRVQIGINDPNMTGGYRKITLDILDHSDDWRFLKLFVLPDRHDEMNEDLREYSISGIELNTKKNGIKDYKIAASYKFTGSQFDGSLTSETDGLITIDLDLRSTYYRLKSSEKGKGYQAQLDSVYFSLDNWIMQKYGEVYSIQGQYTEQFFNTMVIHDEYPEVLDAIVSHGTPLNEYYGCDTSVFCDHFCGNSDIAGYEWNCGYFSDITFLMGLFKRTEEDPGVSSEDKIAYANRYDLWTKAEIFWLNDLEKNYRFRPRYKSFNITIEDSFDLLTFNSNHKWYQTLWEYGLFTGIFRSFDEEKTGIEAIVRVDPNDLIRESESISDIYLIDDSDVDEFKKYVSDSVSNAQSTYLFRFDTQDYFSTNMYFQNGRVSSTLTGYYTEETAYHNFDILSITFRDDQNRYTLLPVISDPKDIVSDSTPPLSIGEDLKDLFSDAPDFRKLIGYILIALVVLVVFWVISKFLPKRVKVVNRSGRRRRRR